MKKTMSILGAILFASVILTSCGGNSNDKKEETMVEDTIKTSVDSLKENSTTKTEPEKIEPANVSCKIYFKGDDMTDEEGNESKGTVHEREVFRTNKSYTFCYDSEGFHNLILNGTGKQLSFLVKSGNRFIFKKEKFDLDGKLTFSSKDFNFFMGETYSIIIKQNETIIFSGKIDSQGCM